MKTIKNNNLPVEVFDRLLDNYGLKKTVFAEKARIAYPTVAGWSNSGKVPLYAFELAKNVIRQLGLKKDVYKANITNRRYVEINLYDEQAIIKKVEVAFWGKNVDPQIAIEKAKDGDAKCCVQIMKNLYHKEATRLLGTKRVKAIAKKYERDLGTQVAVVYRQAV